MERETGGIIFPIVQNFSLLDNDAHRSQYGLKATLNKKGKYKYRSAKHMRYQMRPLLALMLDVTGFDAGCARND